MKSESEKSDKPETSAAGTVERTSVEELDTSMGRRPARIISSGGGSATAVLVGVGHDVVADWAASSRPRPLGSVKGPEFQEHPVEQDDALHAESPTKAPRKSKSGSKHGGGGSSRRGRSRERRGHDDNGGDASEGESDSRSDSGSSRGSNPVSDDARDDVDHDGDGDDEDGGDDERRIRRVKREENRLERSLQDMHKTIEMVLHCEDVMEFDVHHLRTHLLDGTDHPPHIYKAVLHGICAVIEITQRRVEADAFANAHQQQQQQQQLRSAANSGGAAAALVAGVKMPLRPEFGPSAPAKPPPVVVPPPSARPAPNKSSTTTPASAPPAKRSR